MTSILEERRWSDGFYTWKYKNMPNSDTVDSECTFDDKCVQKAEDDLYDLCVSIPTSRYMLQAKRGKANYRVHINKKLQRVVTKNCKKRLYF